MVKVFVISCEHLLLAMLTFVCQVCKLCRPVLIRIVLVFLVLLAVIVVVNFVWIVVLRNVAAIVIVRFLVQMPVHGHLEFIMALTLTVEIFISIVSEVVCVLLRDVVNPKTRVLAGLLGVKRYVVHI